MTSENGSYYACGVGSALMGRGAHVVLIDDPFGSMADARSEPKRKEVWNWFTGTVYNRLEKNGAIVVINHRMHHDDLSGRLLTQQAAGGDEWTVVELKAVSPSGEALWPEKFDEDALDRIKRNTSAQDWSALYQQEPTPDEGGYFKEAWLRPVLGELPAHMNYYGASDLAVTADGGDYTCHGIIGVDECSNSPLGVSARSALEPAARLSRAVISLIATKTRRQSSSYPGRTTPPTSISSRRPDSFSRVAPHVDQRDVATGVIQTRRQKPMHA